MNILPLPATWKDVSMSDKEQHPELPERRVSKSKQREIQESGDEGGIMVTYGWVQRLHLKAPTNGLEEED